MDAPAGTDVVFPDARVKPIQALASISPATAKVWGMIHQRNPAIAFKPPFRVQDFE